MSIPNYVKIKKDGVEYVSGLDRCSYTMKELSRAALRDVGKFVCKKARSILPKRTGRARKNLQYWVRSKQQEYPDVQIGYKPGGFYGGFYETGTDKVQKIAPIYGSVSDSIGEIRKIEGQYLSAIEDDNAAAALIDESEEISDDG